MYMYLEELLKFEIPDHRGMTDSSIYVSLFFNSVYINSFIHGLQSCTEPGQYDLS